MGTQRTFKGLTRRTRLLLARQEDYDVEFKRSVAGIDQGDLVAFANSPRGGTLLLGVDEGMGPDGRQCGIVVGCPVGDREKMIIQNKASDCVPPVRAEIFIENTAKRPLIRLEIPSGPNKPYCTRRGTYKIRGDGRTDAMYPLRLLSIFVEKEGERFLERFRRATGQMKSSVQADFTAVLSDLASMEERINASLGQIFRTASEAELESSQAKGYSDETLELLRISARRLGRIEGALRNNNDKVDFLLEHLGLVEALGEEQRKAVFEFLERQRRRLPTASPEQLMHEARARFSGVAREELSSWVTEFLGSSAASRS